MKHKLIFLLAVLLALSVFNTTVTAQDTSIEAQLRQAKETYDLIAKKFQTATTVEDVERLGKELAVADKKVKVLTNLVGKTSDSPPSEPIDNQPRPATEETATPTTTSTPATAEVANTTQTITDCKDRKDVFNNRICRLASDAFNRKKNAPNEKFKITRGASIEPLKAVIYGQILGDGTVIVDDAIKNFILNAEDANTDKQTGADANAKGTTSIVVKGGVPAVLNFGVENGGATRSIDGTTVTFRFNPVGFIETLANKNPLTAFARGFAQVSNTNKTKNSNEFSYESKPINYFRKLAVGLAFDTSRGQTLPTLTGRERQLSAVSVKYEFLNERNARHPKYNDDWKKLALESGSTLIEKLTRIEQVIFDDNQKFKNTLLEKWLENTNKALENLPQNSTVADIETEIKNQLKLIPVEELRKDADLLKALNATAQANIDFQKEQKLLLNKIAKAPVIAFEYTNYREPVLPDTHNFNFIFAKGIPLGKRDDAPVMDLSFNASLTFFNKKPADLTVKRINNFSFAGQLDIPLGGVNPEANFFGTVFSFAGKYQRLTGNATALDGTPLPNTKGDIWVGQSKLTIPLDRFGLTGIKFPISVTFANRTELVRESRVRGNFGFTFDIDKIILAHFLKK
jgi:hypothetical protein